MSRATGADIDDGIGLAIMKRPRFSLLFLLEAFVIASAFMACVKVLGVPITSLVLIVICSCVTLWMAFRIRFYDR